MRVLSGAAGQAGPPPRQAALPPGQALRRCRLRAGAGPPRAHGRSPGRARGRRGALGGVRRVRQPERRALPGQLHRRRREAPRDRHQARGPRCPGRPRGGGSRRRARRGHAGRARGLLAGGRALDDPLPDPARSALRGAGPRDRGRSPVSPGACAGPRDDASGCGLQPLLHRPRDLRLRRRRRALLPRVPPARLLLGVPRGRRELQLLLLRDPGWGDAPDGPQGAPSRASRGRSAPPIGPGAGGPAGADARRAPPARRRAAEHGRPRPRDRRRGGAHRSPDGRGHSVRHGRRGDRGRNARGGVRGRRPRRAVPPAIPPPVDGRVRPGLPMVAGHGPRLRPAPRPAGRVGRDDAPPRLRVLHGVGPGHDGTEAEAGAGRSPRGRVGAARGGSPSVGGAARAAPRARAAP